MRYESRSELLKAVEKRLKGRVSDEVWAVYQPGWDGPYDDDDVTEIVDDLREAKAEIIREDGISASWLRSEIDVREVEEVVGKCRRNLFGSPDPPFDVFEEMGEWIREEAANQPRPEGHAPRFGYRLDTRDVPPEQAREIVKSRVEENPGPHGLEFATLAYPVDGWVSRVIVPDGTRLRRLWGAVRYVAKQLDCQQAQATALILTGAVPVVSALSATTTPIVRRDGPSRGKVVITIRGPVSDDDLLRFYRKLRQQMWDDLKAYKPLKERDAELVRFISERLDPDNPQWQKLTNEWDQIHPQWQFDYADKLRVTFWRAWRKVYPGVKFGTVIVE